jgi:hypothetical protein
MSGPTHADLLARIDGIAALLVDQLPAFTPRPAAGFVYYVVLPLEESYGQMQLEIRTYVDRIELRLAVNGCRVWTRCLTMSPAPTP